MKVKHSSIIEHFPEASRRALIQAVESVPQSIFFKNGEPRKSEIREFDHRVACALRESGCKVCRNFKPFEASETNNKFEVDLACYNHKVLIEIEKGKLPRLELDVIKIASACLLFPEKWRFGAIIVPTSYIKLPLAGRVTPFEYLKRIAPLVKPVLQACKVRGFLVIGYSDPRG